jgi:hypothetical protein
MNQSYIGEITACYLNMSKQSKEYVVGYIRLTDENGVPNTYKFLVFKPDIVSKIKDISPENLKGKTVSLSGVFAQNTYNGTTEYQLTVSDIMMDDPVMQPVPEQVQQPVNMGDPSTEVPTVPTVPSIPTV